MNENSLNYLPEKSRHVYEKTYAEFTTWCDEQELKDYSETVLLTYFSNFAKNGLIGSLWPKYSMLKSTLKLKNNIDISKFEKLIAFIKSQNKGYTPKKSKVLERQHIEIFISDAPDNLYLMMKVALIFGVSGGMRKYELLKLQTDDVQDLGVKFLITVKASPEAKAHTNRIFTIIDNEKRTLLNLIKHYISLRPPKTPHKRFFIYYKRGRCSTQPIGINTFSKLPSFIATFLKLDQPQLYTGHCFRRSSASIRSESGADALAFTRFGGETSAAGGEEWYTRNFFINKETATQTLKPLEIFLPHCESEEAEKSIKENPNPFQIELVPHFDPTAQGVTTETNNLDQIKQEVEDYDPLSPPSLKQDFKSEDSLSKPASSSHIDTIVGSNESNNDVYIKTECDDDNTFEIEGRQYAEDLKLLLPQQRDIVRQLVANIICRAKMNLLSLEESCPQL